MTSGSWPNSWIADRPAPRSSGWMTQQLVERALGCGSGSRSSRPSPTPRARRRSAWPAGARTSCRSRPAARARRGSGSSTSPMRKGSRSERTIARPMLEQPLERVRHAPRLFGHLPPGEADDAVAGDQQLGVAPAVVLERGRRQVRVAAVGLGDRAWRPARGSRPRSPGPWRSTRGCGSAWRLSSRRNLSRARCESARGSWTTGSRRRPGELLDVARSAWFPRA